jgi:predicted small lipoprotein YifL
MQGAAPVSQSDRPFLRIALIGALIASLGLSACGRKGPLDPPPAASYTGQQPAPSAQQSATMNSNVTAKPLLGPDGRVLLPAGTPKKQIPLDVLLN